MVHQHDPLNQGNLLETRGFLHRSIEMLGFSDLDEFLEFIRNKVVLDLGSGGGGFAIDYEFIRIVNHLEDYTRIYSLNPRAAYHTVEQLDSFNSLKSLKWYYPEIFKNLDDETIKKAHAEANRKARYLTVPYQWESLPFEDEMIDTIFSTGAYIFYPYTFNERSFREIFRVLKKGGTMRIDVSSLLQLKDRVNDIVAIIKSLNLNLEIKIIEPVSTLQNEIFYIEIIKT